MEQHPRNPFIGTRFAFNVDWKLQGMKPHWEDKFTAHAILVLAVFGKYIEELSINAFFLRHNAARNITNLVISALSSCPNLTLLDVECDDDSRYTERWARVEVNALLPPNFQVPRPLKTLRFSGASYLVSLQDALLELCHGQLEIFGFHYWTAYLYSRFRWNNLQEMAVHCHPLFVLEPWTVQQMQEFLASMTITHLPNLRKLTISGVKEEGYFQQLLEMTHKLPKLRELELTFENTKRFHGFSRRELATLPPRLTAALWVKSLTVCYSHAGCFQDFGYLLYFPALERLRLKGYGPGCHLRVAEKLEFVQIWLLLKERESLYQSNVWKVMPLLKRLEVDWSFEESRKGIKQTLTRKGYDKWVAEEMKLKKGMEK